MQHYLQNGINPLTGRKGTAAEIDHLKSLSSEQYDEVRQRYARSHNPTIMGEPIDLRPMGLDDRQGTPQLPAHTGHAPAQDVPKPNDINHGRSEAPNVRSHTDYPCNSASWPVISKRMLNTLLDVREFPHRTWTVPFVGFPDNAPVMLLEEGLSGGVRYENEFVVVQLLERLDIFDCENSVYEMWRLHDEAPETVYRIDKLVLHIPEGGLPPIFRMNVLPIHWYVSPEARAALEAADIKGIRFK